MITVVVIGERCEAMKHFLMDTVAHIDRRLHASPEQLTRFNIIDIPTATMQDALMYGYPKLPREFMEAAELLLLAITPSAQVLLNQLEHDLKQSSFTGKAPTLLRPHNAITKYCRQMGLSRVWMPKSLVGESIDSNLEMRLRKDGIYCPLSQDDEAEVTQLLKHCARWIQYGGNPEELLKKSRRTLRQMAQRYNLQAVLLDYWAKPLLKQLKTDELPLWLDIYSIYAEAACNLVCNTV